MAINGRIVVERPAIYRPNMTAVTALENVTYYARVSTDSDEQEESYERQKEHFEAKIKSNPKWNYIEGYADWGATGTRAETRKNFMRMIDDCRAGKINRILCKSISRFGRNTVDTLKYVRELRDLGISIFFETQQIDTMTAGGDVLITILAAMAEQESRTMSTNIKWSFQKRFKDGRVLINANTLGYKKDGDNYAIVEEEAEIVRTIFRNYIAGDSVRQIAEMLNAEGKRTKCGYLWKANSILNILANDKYTGNAVMGKSFKPDVLSPRRVKNEGQAPSYYMPNSHPAIITQEMFDMAQAEKANRKALRSTAKTGKGKYSQKYILSGLLVCGQCGGKFRRNSRKLASGESVPTWVCITHQLDRDKCGMKPLKEDDVYAAYERAIERLIGDASEIIEIVRQSTQEGLQVDESNGIEEVREALMQARKEVLDLFKARKDGYISSSEYEKKYEEYSRTIIELEEREKVINEQNLQNQLAQRKLDEAYELLVNAGENRLDRDVMRKIVDVIKVNSKHELEFQFKCGVNIIESV